jgi:DHA2 family multidrug resistance protein
LNQQATLYSYVDDLRYMAIVCFACIPLLFLLKRVKAKPGGMAAH